MLGARAQQEGCGYDQRPTFMRCSHFACEDCLVLWVQVFDQYLTSICWYSTVVFHRHLSGTRSVFDHCPATFDPFLLFSPFILFGETWGVRAGIAFIPVFDKYSII